MVRVDRLAFGKFIREARKSKKLRQEDLVDDYLTQPVLSHIENGKGKVSEEKMKYILGKLKINTDISDFYLVEDERSEEEVNEEINIKLTLIEMIIDLINPDEGLEKLRELGMMEDHPTYVYTQYLKGKSYLHKQNWKKAHKHFFDTIYSIEHRYPEMACSNLKGGSYHQLSYIEYAQNNFHQALKYSQTANQCFIDDGEREYFKELILISKAIYLEKLNRLEDVQITLDELEKIKHPMDKKHLKYYISKEAALNMYDVRSSLLAKSKMHSQAIKFALKGLELARIDKMVDRSFELLTTLGRIYIDKDKLNLAENCFETALKLKKNIKSQSLLAYVYTQLSMLYDKRKDLKKAIEKSLEAITFSNKANNAYRECEALIVLGGCYFKQNDNDDKAFQTMNEALELAKHHSFTDLKNKINLMLGTHLNRLGDPNAHQFVFDFFNSHARTLEGDEEQMPKRHSVGEPPIG